MHLKVLSTDVLGALIVNNSKITKLSYSYILSLPVAYVPGCTKQMADNWDTLVNNYLQTKTIVSFCKERQIIEREMRKNELR